MNKIEKQLKKELESRVPKMSSKLMDYPITTSPIVKKKKRFSWYHWLSTATLGLTAVIILMVLLLKPNNTVDPSVTTKHSLYMLEVNPTILFTVDEDDNVVDLKSGNTDADSVLVSLDTTKLVGSPVCEVVEVVTDELIEMGYFSTQSQNAIKLSSLDNENQQQASLIGSKLSNLFCQKGYFVAVIEDQIDITEFNEKYNVQLKDTQGLREYFDSLECLSYQNKKLTDDQIKDEYKNNYLNNYLSELITLELDNIEKSSDLVLEIYNTYNEILESDEIRFPIKDYFQIDKMNLDITNSKVKEKFIKMEELLNSYHELTGNEITNSLELISIKNKHELIYVDEIKEKLEKINSFINDNEFDAWINNMVELLDLDNKYNINDIIKSPDSVEELEEKINTINNKINENKKEKFKNEFNESKEKITEDQYKDYIDSIIEEHGSLSDFWKKKK